MKSKFFMLLMVICMVGVITSCNNNENPPSGGNNEPPFGDNLGGGGIADESEKMNTTVLEELIESSGNIDLSELSLDIDYSDAVDLTTNEISASGKYMITGNYENGISITAPKNASIHLVLKDAHISCNNGKAIANQNKCNIIITVLGNNTIENDGDDVNAVHLKGNVGINGNGTLNIISHSKSAIKVSKNISIVDTTIYIESANHGITAETIAMKNVSINIASASKDGLHAECDYDEPDSVEDCIFDLTIGYVSLVNVDFVANTFGDGIQADTFVYIDGGNYEIKTTGNFVAKTSDNMTMYELEEDDFKYIKVGNTYQRVAKDYRGYATLYALAQGCKGIKVGEIEYDIDGDGVDDGIVNTNTNYTILIKNGTFTIDSTDDAIHSNSGDILIFGGNYVIRTFDDGMSADNLLKIKTGNIEILSSYEGLEGGYVEIEGGNISIVSTDDGINAASDDTSIKEHIIISGGKIVVNASGDGIDSNGTILISDGEVIVFGPTNGGDGGLDSENGILVNGGIVFVTSTLGMVETPGSNSTSYVLSYASQTTMTSGSTFKITDEFGNELYTVDLLKNCQSIIISIPQFEVNQKYNLYINDQLVETFTIQSILTSIGSQNGQGRPGKPGDTFPR